jgi:SH3 domain-containing YSC84-like protein 1
MLIAACAVALLMPHPAVRAQSKEHIDRLNDSMKVLRDLTRTPDDGIPQYLLQRAEAIIVIPDMIRGGFVFGAKHGKGVVSMRDRSTDRWSPPAFIKMTGGSVGWQIGAQSVDLVLLVMNENGVRKLLDNKFTLGGELSAVAGPVGRTASAGTDISLESEILTYSRAKGLFAGATFEGVSLRADDDANNDVYGQEINLKDIVLNPARDLRVPMVASTWMADLRDLIQKTANDRAPRGDVRYDRDRPYGSSTPYMTPPVGFGGEVVKVGDVAEHPKKYYGKQVMLAGEVDNLYNRTVFAIDDDPMVSTGRSVVIIAPTLTRMLSTSQSVSVVGDVMQFDKGKIEKRFHDYKLDLNDDLRKSFDDKAVIVATSVRTKDGEELLGTKVIR